MVKTRSQTRSKKRPSTISKTHSRTRSQRGSVMKQYSNDLKRRGKNNIERLNILKRDMETLFFKIKNNPKQADIILEQNFAGKVVSHLVKKLKSNKKFLGNSKRIGLVGGAQGRNFMGDTVLPLLVIFIFLGVVGMGINEMMRSCVETVGDEMVCTDLMQAFSIIGQAIFQFITMFID